MAGSGNAIRHFHTRFVEHTFDCAENVNLLYTGYILMVQ